jgi:PIN domain nuclease of toxin-antitoxin system
MRFLLDTHVLIWYLENDSKLSQKHADLIEDSVNEVFVSDASLWEMAIKAKLGKLNLPLQLSLVQLEQHLQSLDLKILKLETKHFDATMQLPLHHGDPFDRVLIAQAVVEQATVLTEDNVFKAYTEITLF